MASEARVLLRVGSVCLGLLFLYAGVQMFLPAPVSFTTNLPPVPPGLRLAEGFAVISYGLLLLPPLDGWRTRSGPAGSCSR